MSCLIGHQISHKWLLFFKPKNHNESITMSLIKWRNIFNIIILFIESKLFFSHNVYLSKTSNNLWICWRNLPHICVLVRFRFYYCALCPGLYCTVVVLSETNRQQWQHITCLIQIFYKGSVQKVCEA